MAPLVARRVFLIFVAVAKDLKRDGTGVIAHYPPIEENDLTKMYEYFEMSDNVKLQQKLFVDIMLYFGRRGQDQIHELYHCFLFWLEIVFFSKYNIRYSI
jgi:hypothetical protein